MKNFLKQVNDYYPTYLEAHKNPYNKAFHFVGNVLLLATTIFVLYYAFNTWVFAQALFVLACYLPFHWTWFIYLFAWPGHLLIEKNKPATWSVSRWITKACDWKMMFDLVRGKLKWDTRK